MTSRSSLVVLVGLLLAAAGSIAAQSLGDLAKKTQADRERAAAERKKAGQDSKAADDSAKGAKDPKAATPKIYTDKDVKALEGSVPSGTSPTASTSTDVAPADASKDAPKPASATATLDAAKRDEAYWRARQAPLYAKLAVDTDAALKTLTRLRELQSKVEPNLPSLAVYGPEITRLRTQLQEQNAAVAADEAAIEAMKEEGRRAGALPGWFR